MAYYRVMLGPDCYGVSNTFPGAQALLSMHKDTKNGHKKESKISTLNLTIDTVQGEYPTTKSLAALSYKPGRYPQGGGEYK